MLQEDISSFVNSNLFDKKLKEYERLEKLRLEFVNKFKSNRILQLTLDEYVVGKKDIIDGGDDTFCYWLETKLIELGMIKGGSPADKKFGIYYGKTKNDNERKYRTIGKWGQNYEEAFKNIKDSINQLIIYGENDDYAKIELNKLSPMFKGKILSTYFPERYISIFSEEHIDHFIHSLPIFYQYKKTKTIEIKKRLLLELKNNDERMKYWNNHIFMVFLYTFYSPRKKDVDDNKEKYNYDPEVEYIDFGYKGKLDPEKSKTGNNKPDYEKGMKRKEYIGNLGENIIYNEEIKKLNKYGRKDLIDEVKVVSKENDRLGYDILSFDKDGHEIYIEVKSTIHSPKKIDFIITQNEYQQFLSKDNYFIYLVYEVESKHPKIHILKREILIEEYMKPIAYRVGIRTE